MPANLTQPCDPLQPLPDKATMGDLLQSDIETINLYNQCATRHEGLANWVLGQ